MKNKQIYTSCSLVYNFLKIFLYNKKIYLTFDLNFTREQGATNHT